MYEQGVATIVKKVADTQDSDNGLRFGKRFELRFSTRRT